MCYWINERDFELAKCWWICNRVSLILGALADVLFLFPFQMLLFLSISMGWYESPSPHLPTHLRELRSQAFSPSSPSTESWLDGPMTLPPRPPSPSPGPFTCGPWLCWCCSLTCGGRSPEPMKRVRSTSLLRYNIRLEKCSHDRSQYSDQQFV